MKKCAARYMKAGLSRREGSIELPGESSAMLVVRIDHESYALLPECAPNGFTARLMGE